MEINGKKDLTEIYNTLGKRDTRRAGYIHFIDVIGYISPKHKNDLPAGIMLSYITSSFHGRQKDNILVMAEDNWQWLVMTIEDWCNDLRLTKEQTVRTLKLLESLGLVETHLKKRPDGNVAKHIRLIYAAFVSASVAVIEMQ